MGNEGRLGGDLLPGTNPFIFLLRYRATRVTADKRHEQRSHGKMSGSDIVSYIQPSVHQLYPKQHCPFEQVEGRLLCKIFNATSLTLK